MGGSVSRAHKTWSRSFLFKGFSLFPDDALIFPRAFHSDVIPLSESLEQPILKRVVVDKEQVKIKEQHYFGTISSQS